MQKTIKILAASYIEAKKITSSLTAIRGELNKLKRPTEHPLEEELQPARKKKKVSIPKVQVDISDRGKLMEDFPILKDGSLFHNWWRNGHRNIPLSKTVMVEFLTELGILAEILKSLTLSEMAESFCLVNVMCFLSKKKLGLA